MCLEFWMLIFSQARDVWSNTLSQCWGRVGSHTPRGPGVPPASNWHSRVCAPSCDLWWASDIEDYLHKRRFTVELTHEIMEAQKFWDLHLENQQRPSCNVQFKTWVLKTWLPLMLRPRVPQNLEFWCPQAEEIECPQKRKWICLESAFVRPGFRVDWTVLTNWGGSHCVFCSKC